MSSSLRIQGLPIMARRFVIMALFFINIFSVDDNLLIGREELLISSKEINVRISQEDKERFKIICYDNGISKNICDQTTRLYFKKQKEYYFRTEPFIIDKYPVSVKSYLEFCDANSLFLKPIMF